jgi:hypothetical protein
MNDDSQNLERSIGRLEGKIDGLAIGMGSLKADVVSLSNDFSGRLSRLEISFATLSTEVSVKAQSKAIWISAGMSFIVSVVSAMVIYLIIHQISV